MRHAMRNLRHRLMFLALMLPVLGTGCLLDATDIRDQALTNIQDIINGLFKTAVANAFNALT